MEEKLLIFFCGSSGMFLLALSSLLLLLSSYLRNLDYHCYIFVKMFC
ncbi:hypothetical protein ERO13_A05G278250v2 [Gossypium hirsutum]|nr:hypothetical protein ERO13_A05G278250v2 [Gossypium hirsutum]